LVDGIGHLNPVLRGKFGEKVEIKTISAGGGWGLRRLGFGGDATVGFADTLLDAAESRAWWSRFGL
ncbi:MAG: S49 family peptidase, partial [Hyphomicrobiales bacterium]